MLHQDVVVFGLLCWSWACLAVDKPTVFNLMRDRGTPTDELIHEHFDQLYNVVDINGRERAFKLARGIRGFGPTKPVYAEGRCSSGNVLVLYVITADGSVASAYPAKSTDRVLSDAAVQSMTQRWFQPAEVDGKAAATLAATRFTFDCPS